MKPEVDLHGLSKPKPWEYGLRFLFGGMIAVVASLVAKSLGDFAGGMALAFPAILPAALTLVKEHDGRPQAADDARGARFGAAGLSAFGVVVLVSASRGPWAALPLAWFTWLVIAIGSWWLVYGRR